MTPVPQSASPLTVKYRMPSVHPEGIKFVAISAAITFTFGFIFSGPVWHVLAWLMGGVTIWVAAFFRDPVRVTPRGAGLIVSPADGLVCQISDVEVPRQLAGEGGLPPGLCKRVSIFMSVFDVHINRSPIAGIISRIVYVPGKFLNADMDKASDDNERQYFIVDGDDGTRVAFTQIAGLVARRIMRFSSEGDRVTAGERVGLIRFGSRVDVFLPAGTGSAVALGQRAVAGETILARIGDPASQDGTAQ